MTSTSSRWRYAAAVSPLALAIAVTPAFGADTAAGQAVVTGAAAAAQPATQPPPPSDTAANPQASDQPAAAQNTIVVTGFRASLRSATAKKKNSETVVESISAEDIGKL